MISVRGKKDIQSQKNVWEKTLSEQRGSPLRPCTCSRGVRVAMYKERHQLTRARCSLWPGTFSMFYM